MPFGIEIPGKNYFKIGEVARLLGVQAHTLRYWETEFPMLRPVKSKSGQRTYSRDDVVLLAEIRHLLYSRRFTIEGARKRLRRLPAEEREAERLASGRDARAVLERVARELDELLRLLDK